MVPHPRPTTEFWHILQEATSDAVSRGHSHVGTEHLLYALASTRGNFGRSILEHLAVAELVSGGLDDMMRSEEYATVGSNDAIGADGELIGHFVVGPDGKPMLERLSPK